MPHEQDAVHSNTDSDSDNDSRSTPAATSPAQQQQQAAAAGMPAYLTRLARHISQHVDMTLLLQMAADVVPPDQQAATAAAAATEPQQQQLQDGHGSQPAVQQAVMDGRAEHALPLTKVPGPSCSIAVARDDAFCFYYQVIPAVMGRYSSECFAMYDMTPLHCFGLHLHGRHQSKVLVPS
jgi:cobyrinic acid a,c-diamide synthase